jgi:superfamily II DNA or RNA helicase
MEILKLLYSKKYSSWVELEKEIEALQLTVDKGNAFEQFCYFYLNYNKDFYQIESVYTDKIKGSEIPDYIRTQLKLSSSDDGVDGVYVTYDGKYVAYQSKFRTGRNKPTSNELNNFWAEAEYADLRLVIANAMVLPADVKKRKNNIFILGHLFDALTTDFFDYLYAEANNKRSPSSGASKVEKYKPRDYQSKIIDAVVEGFRTSDRGKVIAACAAGKTLISLWVSEALNSKNVIFFTPNLALVRQTIANWTKHNNERFMYLAVCSDETVAAGASDSFTIGDAEIDIPVTTDNQVIKDFLESKIDCKKVVFSTYQSVDCIIEALNLLPDFVFDFGIYDEAHRTAGASTSGLFQKALLNSNIKIAKRLFMTATERLATPRLKARFAQQNRVLFSMDDEDKYGKVFYRLPFGQAIEEGIIADYKIMIAAMTSEELANLIRGNAYVNVSHDAEEIASDVAAQTFFKCAMFSKVMFATDATKAVSYHSSIPAARSFMSLVGKLPEIPENSSISHVNGGYTAAARAEVFKLFEDAPFGLITNVRCLTEGVDIPYIDAIMFADPRNSLIDIVQAVGRALRKPFGVMHKTSYIIVPILLNEKSGGIDDDDAYVTMHSIIQALRDQDETLADWIDKINLAVVKGGGSSGGGFGEDDPIGVFLSKDIDYDKFCNNLAIRISVANAKPTGATGLGSTLGKTERGSTITRVFKTLADYNYQALRDSLIDPTIELFKDTDQSYSRSSIIINNNNVSHTERLGLIRKCGKNEFVLTPLGKQYKERRIEFPELFLNQALLYGYEKNGNLLFPYRAALKVLAKVNTLNYLEFLYGIYSMDTDIVEDDAVDLSVLKINLLRDEYPNVMSTSIGNQEEIRQILNNVMGIEYSERDVWTDRTTTGNQFRFFLNHLGLFTNCFVIDYTRKEIVISKAPAIYALLEKSKKIIDSPDFMFGQEL